MKDKKEDSMAKKTKIEDVKSVGRREEREN